MDSKTAKTIMHLLDSASEQLMGTIDAIKQTEDRSAVRNHVDTISKICMLFSKIRYPIKEEYPELEPDVAMSDVEIDYIAAMAKLVRHEVATGQTSEVMSELSSTERIYAVAMTNLLREQQIASGKSDLLAEARQLSGLEATFVTAMTKLLREQILEDAAP